MTFRRLEIIQYQLHTHNPSTSLLTVQCTRVVGNKTCSSRHSGVVTCGEHCMSVTPPPNTPPPTSASPPTGSTLHSVCAYGCLCVLQAVKLTSSRTQLPYEYYSLPFCKPDSVFYKGENLGEYNVQLREGTVFEMEIRDKTQHVNSVHLHRIHPSLFKMINSLFWK